MNINIDNLMRKYQSHSKIMVKANPRFKEETCYDNLYSIPEEMFYEKVSLEHLSDCHYFRRNFVGHGSKFFLTCRSCNIIWNS